jgi:2'-5' RNA ligase
MTKRLFIGIPIQSEMIFQVGENWKTNEKLYPEGLKWVNPANWHVTLIFLGNTPETEIPGLQSLIELCFADIQAFRTNLRGMGVFPNSNSPKVLWLGIENLVALLPAQNSLVELLKQNGFSLDNKPFKPHVTLARIKNSANRMAIDSLINQYQNFNFGSVTISNIILYESISTADGPIYKPLFEKILK